MVYLNYHTPLAPLREELTRLRALVSASDSGRGGTFAAWCAKA